MAKNNYMYALSYECQVCYAKLDENIKINLDGNYQDLRFCIVNKDTNKKLNLSFIKTVEITDILDEVPIQLLKIDNGLISFGPNQKLDIPICNEVINYHGKTNFKLKYKETNDLENYKLEIYGGLIKYINIQSLIT